MEARLVLCEGLPTVSLTPKSWIPLSARDKHMFWFAATVSTLMVIRHHVIFVSFIEVQDA
jgi:hypothetical protein